MYKVAIIGDKDTIMPFKVLGIDTFSLSVSEHVENEMKKIIDKLSKDYAIIYIVEEYFEYAKKSYDKYKKEILPMIIVLPSNKSNLNLGNKFIDENVYKAIGTNIF